MPRRNKRPAPAPPPPPTDPIALLTRTLDLLPDEAAALLSRWLSRPADCDLYMEGLAQVARDGSWTRSEIICSGYKAMYDRHGRHPSMSPKGWQKCRRAALAILAREDSAGRPLPFSLSQIPSAWMKGGGNAHA